MLTVDCYIFYFILDVSRSTLIPGSLPNRNLPSVPFQTPEPDKRLSYESICEKRSAPVLEESRPPSYKSFDDLSRRVVTISYPEWSNTINLDNILL